MATLLSVKTNPIHVLAAQALRGALGRVAADGPDLRGQFKRALTGQIAERDAPVLDAALAALDATGYTPEDFDNNFGFNNLSTAVQAAVRDLLS
jgi:hypothetical protein